MKRPFLLMSILVMSLLVRAQHVSLRQLSQTPVLGAEEARSIMFDRDGLMWIGTDQGVRSYDGYRFRTYRSDAYTPGILPNNYVPAMTEGSGSQLWIGTRDGIVCFDRRHGTFRTYHLRGEQARTIDALFTSSDGVVWAGTNSGVSRYDAEKDDFIDINMTAGVRSFAEDEKGNIYIGTWAEGLFRLDKKSGKLVAYPQMNERNTVQSMIFDSRGRLWIGTWEHGIIRLDRPDNETDPGIHRMNEGRQDFRTFRSLVEDPVSHSVWGCCIEGLTRVDLDDDGIVENHPGLSFCYGMKTDGKGNLWVLTRNNGLVHLSTKTSPFRFCHLDPAGLTLPVNRIQTVFTLDGNLFWLGLQPYGLALYDRQADRVVYNTQIPGMSNLTGIFGIHVQTIADILRISDDELWLASTPGILVWRRDEATRLLPRQGMPFIEDGSVNALHRQADGTVWVGQSNGVGLAFSETKGRMLKMSEGGRDFSSCDVHDFLEDHLHRIWIATEDAGIICVKGDVRHPESVSCHQYAPVNGNYPVDNATTVYEDTEHHLWAVSTSGELFLHDAEKDAFEPVNDRYHINAHIIYAIVGDRQGWMWLSTDQGLVRLRPSLKHGFTTYYSVDDGAEVIRFSSNGAFSYGDELFFGSASGFFSFSPARMDQWQQASPASLIVSGLIIDDLPYDRLAARLRSRISEDQPQFTRKITIPSDIEKFSIEFALLTYQNQQQCHYFYRLEGYDRDWHHTNAENRQAIYQNLPVGSYELSLRAIDSYGHVVDMPYTISVRVLPPWYKTWWAYLIYLALLAAAVYGITQWYKQRVNRRARLQQRVSELLHYRELMVMRQFEGARKALEAEEQQHNSPDELFIQKAIDCVKQHLDDADYDREQFASDMCVSSSTLYNKLRALTGQNVTAFINSIRLKEACRILRQQPDIKITELSMEVGFNTPKYFTKLFKKEFGILPSEYIAQGQE